MKTNGKREIEFLSPEEGEKLLDKQARRYLNMSGKEFVCRWKAKKIKDPDRPEVMQVAFLIPFARVKHLIKPSAIASTR
jgi:hypothetical protein